MLIDSSGDVVKKVVLGGIGEGLLHDAIRDNSGGYIAIGGFGDYYAYGRIVKVDENLNLVWAKDLGGRNISTLLWRMKIATSL